jgi:5'-nucleotidase / UDP-sugar diphosphatase
MPPMRHSLRTSALILAPIAALAFASGGAACGGGDTGTGGNGGSGAHAQGGQGPGGSGGGTQVGGGGSAPDKTVVVLFTSDEHSHLFAFSPELDDFPIATTPQDGTLVGGVARRAAVIKKERKAASDAGKDSILVSAGDNQMGCLPHTAFESESIDYQNMQVLGYDVTTFGNHEFDFGPLALAQSITTARSKSGLPPIVASNIHFSGTAGDQPLADLYSANVGDSKPVHPYRVLTTTGGVKIGVLGYVGVNAAHVAPNKTPTQFSAKGVDPKKEGDQATVLPKLYADLQPVVDKLRNVEKVDLVIALAHGGINDTSTEAGIEAGDDWNVCKNVTGIDFIVSGHAHNPDPKPIEVTNTAKKDCLVLNGSSFGQHLGRVEFTIPGDKSKDVSWDKASQALIPIDDKTLADTTEAAAVPGIVETIEKGTYLPSLLRLTTGAPVNNDTGTPGDLYFFNVGHTDFDVTDTHSLLFLSADSMLKAADAYEVATGVHTDMGLESAGVIRAGIKKGKTGNISAADAFNVVPLGSSPTNDGSIGYPLVRGNITALELKLVFEFALKNRQSSNDYDLGTSGLQITYDPSLPSLGQVTKLVLDGDHSDGYDQFTGASAVVLYDKTLTPPFPDQNRLVAIVTSSYIAQFAGDAGVTLVDDMGSALTVEQARILRADNSEIKQIEAFFGWVYQLNQTPFTGLPPLYNVNDMANRAQRWVTP